ncbi:MAG: DNA methyltransferase [Desulfobacterales bacterium]|nr:DNA methyltransferase [Desulfobacterales bacterium]
MSMGDLFEDQLEENQKIRSGPVTCLGMTFENDEARRIHFTEELRKKLQDPEFRNIEGFPIGSEEDILNLSDPPYYTVCPNPWLTDFIAEWAVQNPEQPDGYHYHREPFAADVSEGKNDPIYNAHSYHTKVPHKAIMRYILHYTQPGDIVFDGFCGTGMTGVAAQMCGNREVVMSLGYQVKPDGTILQEETDEDGKKVWRPFSRLGVRRAVLNDLSPAATFIAYNYNTPVDVSVFQRRYREAIREFKKQTKWMWETLHSDGKTIGKINYVVWSEVYSCPECLKEIDYFTHAFTNSADGSFEYTPEFACPNCGSLCAKSPTKKSLAHKLSRVRQTLFDEKLQETIRTQKRLPVLINYSIGTKRFQKLLDLSDQENILRIERLSIINNIPIDRMPEGDESRRNDDEGMSHVHHFYTKRILASLSILEKVIGEDPQLNFLMGSTLPKLTILNRYMPQHGGRALVGPMANTLYVPPVGVENNVIDQLEFQSKKIIQALTPLSGSIICTHAAQSVSIPEASVDYIFIDPPFGANIMYSELSFMREAWLRAKTNNKPEAVENKTQKKGIDEYRHLMTECFASAFKCLKPGRWMTVEFSNTKASVWNSIQNSLSDAGFIVASVAALDKTRGGLHSMLGPTAVKQDLVISAYKPNGGFEERFQKEAQTEEGVWVFVRTHLKYLPVTKQQGALLQFVPERDPRILFDQMVAFYVRKGYPVPISSQEFQIGLAHRFIERDGMYFLPDQVAEYDRKKMTAGISGEYVDALFVKDESTAIEWLRARIRKKPQTFSDINPQFMQQLGGWSKNEAQLDLRELLNQNFLCYDGKGLVPEQIHAYLSTNWKELRNLPKDAPALVAKARDRWYVPDPNKAGDLEKLREKALLKEFEEYKEVKKKLKIFRLEAVRAGFKKAWQERDYAVIVAVADKIPNNVLEEDPKLLMWYDQAVTRMGGE